MSYDLEYVLTGCNHRYVDDIVQSQVDLESVTIAEGARFGVARYGTPTRFGDTSYTIANPLFGITGSYYEDQGRIVAVLPLTYQIGSSAKVFVRYPDAYQRIEVPETIHARFATGLYSGAGWFSASTVAPFLVDLIIESGGWGFVPDDTAVYPMWIVNYTSGTVQQYVDEAGPFDIPANSVLISFYQNQMDWIVDYTAREATCPICSGSGYKNDISFGVLGRLNLVRRTAKLAQLVMKSTLTDKGTNDYFPDYGTTLATMIGSMNYSKDILLRTEIFNQLKTIKYTYDKAFINDPTLYDPYELLEDILGVDMIPGIDPRAITLRVHVLCKALEEIITKSMSMVR